MSFADRPVAFKVYLTNVGKRPVLRLKKSPTLRISEEALTSREEDEGMTICKGTTMVQEADKNEIQPGESIYFISTSPLFTLNDLHDITASKKRAYLMVEAIYADDKTLSDKQIVTEFCAYFSGPLDHYVSCSDHNKIYVEERRPY